MIAVGVGRMCEAVFFWYATPVSSGDGEINSVDSPDQIKSIRGTKSKM